MSSITGRRSEFTVSSSDSDRLTRSTISALVEHIQEAAKVIEDHYSSLSTDENPSGVPSLEHPQEHPLDRKIMTREMRAAVQTIEGACAQLVDTVGNPNHILMNRFMEFYYPTCLNAALMYKIPDVLQEKPEGMHISEIEKKTGINHRKIGRVLRMLASRHIFKEVSENVFANNRLSIHLLSSNPLSDMGLHFGDEAYKSSVHLPELLADKEWGHSFSHKEAAFNKYSGYEGTMFEHYEHDHPVGTHRGARFGRGLIAWAAALESHSILHGYPWKELGNVTVCDLGSGVGAMSMELAKTYPNLRFVLQDMPNRLKQGETEIWPERCPEALAQDRVQWVPFDLFTDPPVSGCDVYYLKNIIHDWSDEVAIKVLTNVRLSMAPHSRVLVQEHILQHAHRVPDPVSDIKHAPHPMLPNYGAGRIRHYSLDIQLLNFLNSEVRTLSQFIKLGEAAGLEYVRVLNLGETDVIEYRLR